MNISLSATLAMFCLAASGSASDPTIRTAAGLAAYRNGPPSAERPYDIEGQVTLVKATHLWVQDKTGITSMANTFKTPPVVGDIVHISGVAKFNDCGNVTTRHRSHGRVVGHADPPAPRRIAIADAERPENDMRLVEVEGVVADCFPDEIDSKTDLLVIRDGAATLPIAIARGHIPNMSDIIDARIRATGFASRSPIGQRRTQGAMLIAMGEGSIGIVKPPPADRFAYPPFSYYPSRTPAELAALGRHTVSGLVVAAWKDSRLMLMTDRLHVSAVELVRGVAPPRCGSWIQVAGYPASDLYTVNFTRCFFRQIPGASGENAPEKASLPKLAAKGYSSTQIAPLVAGKEVTLRGPLCRDGADTAPQGHFSVDCCGFHVPVDVGLSGIDPEDVLPGSTVKATGIGVLDCDNWRPDMTFPRLRGFFVVMRSPEDLRILAPPPWWTKGRLLALVVGLTLMLAAITALACWLRSLVAKKSRELFDEQIERTSSELRIDERTRLAVELHDTLSQNLEGVACQVAATRAIMGDAAPEARECLFAAERMLESSRKEMRRVLFDLRSDALAEKDFSSALGKALAPIAKGTSLAIRFNIDRAIFSDSTAHAVICIVRELVSNAVVHGHASHIRIAGDRQGDILRFSVRDDGCGFDPASAKGPDYGHFGLSGIRERVRRINGMFDIDSSVGGPTRATVTINLAHADGTEIPQKTEP